MTTNNLNYQQNHLNFLKQKFKELENKPDGFLFYEPSGIHFIVVEKKDNFIRYSPQNLLLILFVLPQLLQVTISKP